MIDSEVVTISWFSFLWTWFSNEFCILSLRKNISFSFYWFVKCTLRFEFWFLSDSMYPYVFGNMCYSHLSFLSKKKKNSDNSYLYHLIVMKKKLHGKKFWKLFLYVICWKIINLYQFYTKIIHVLPFFSNWYKVPLCFCIICGVVWYFGEGNGNPLQYSCLENPTDGGGW